MKCKKCNEKMKCIDDSGSFTTHSQSWDYYICPNCLITASVTKNYSEVTTTWAKADDDDIKKAIRHGVSELKEVSE